MRTVNEVSQLTGVSIRTLQYYDKIGLLDPTGYTQAGYRLYAARGDFTTNIDNAGGEGTAEFTNKAIEIYCR